MLAMIVFLMGQVPMMTAGWDSVLEAWTIADTNGNHVAVKDFDLYANDELVAGNKYMIGGPYSKRQVNSSDLSDGALLALLGGVQNSGQYVIAFNGQTSAQAANVSSYMLNLLSAEDQTAALQALGAAGGTAVPAGTNGQLLMFDSGGVLRATSDAWIESTNLVGASGVLVSGNTVQHDPSIKHIPVNGEPGQYLIYLSAGTAQWADPDSTPDFTTVNVTTQASVGQLNTTPGTIVVYGGNTTTTQGGTINTYFAQKNPLLSGVGTLIQQYCLNTVWALRETGNGTDSTFLAYDANGNQLYSLPVYTKTTSTGAANVYVASDGKLLRATSSRKYKTDIKDLALDPKSIHRLRPVEYKEKSTGERGIGLIAEEVAEIYPDLVEFNGNEPEGVKYDRLAVVMLNEIKALRAELDALKAAQPTKLTLKGIN